MRRTALAVIRGMFSVQHLQQSGFRQLTPSAPQTFSKAIRAPQTAPIRQRVGSWATLRGLTQSAAAANASRERSVRAKAAAAAAAAAAGDARDILDSLYDEQTAATAAAANEATAFLDDLYQDSPGRSSPPPAAAVPPAQPAAAVTPAAADAPDDILVALYDADESAAAARSSPSRVTAVVAAAAADDAPPPAAAAAKQPSSPASSGGGGSSSSRLPPTYVKAPNIPSDLNTFSNAVLLVDKPKDWTSFDACNAIKGAMKRIGVKKVGHAGTLDPAATGLLIICTGQGTKSIEGFMAAHKEYSGTLKLGEGTPTLDAEGEVDERLPWEHITDEQLIESAKKLTGDIEQVPPMFSALHHNGKRLHELARAGVTVERQSRPVTITRFDVHRDPKDRQLVHFYVGCTKGTYIRTLGHDLATSLGTTGHLVALRREAIGDARVDDAWQMEELKDKLYAEIKAQRPDAFTRDDSNRGNKGKRGRGGGRRGGRQQDAEQEQQQPSHEQQPVGEAAVAGEAASL